MTTLPKPQRKPKETLTVALWTSSSRAAARSLVESTCCRAGARDWVCARRERPQNGPSPEVGASPYQRRAHRRAVAGDNPATLGPCTEMRVAVGRDGFFPPAALVRTGAQMTPGEGHAIWVRSSIP
uniref:Protein F n=1 Tax=Hepacivirus hominis TaxID=3052230 RepID=A0A9Y1MWX0_9HEPC|nr:protein F [Hepacivirus hominis]